jgi:hypothetical protein
MVQTAAGNDLVAARRRAERVLEEAIRVRTACRDSDPGNAVLHLCVHGLAVAVAELASLRLQDLAAAGRPSQARPDTEGGPSDHGRRRAKKPQSARFPTKR